MPAITPVSAKRSAFEGREDQITPWSDDTLEGADDAHRELFHCRAAKDRPANAHHARAHVADGHHRVATVKVTAQDERRHARREDSGGRCNAARHGCCIPLYGVPRGEARSLDAR